MLPVTILPAFPAEHGATEQPILSAALQRMVANKELSNKRSVRYAPFRDKESPGDSEHLRATQGGARDDFRQCRGGGMAASSLTSPELLVSGAASGIADAEQAP